VDNPPIALLWAPSLRSERGETPLATYAEQTSCSTPVANRVLPLTHSGDGDNNRLFLFQKTQRAISL